MSHFTRVKTRMTDRTLIVRALEDLGHRPEVGAVEIRGWGGRKQQVEVRVPTRNRGYDIGFVRSNGHYDVVADWWGIRDVPQAEFVAGVTRRYAYHATRARLEEQGFSLVQEQAEPDGRVHLVLRRMG
jgi:hypothetical protein